MAIISWTSSLTSDWTDKFDWTPEQVPGAGDTVEIGPGIGGGTSYDVTETNQTAAAFLLATGSFGTFSAYGSLIIGGAVDVASGLFAVQYATGLLTVGADTLNVGLGHLGSDFAASLDNNDATYVTIAVAPYFAAGTRIAGEHGDIFVEALAPGDLVRTHSGAVRPVLWIGHRHVDCRRHPRPDQVQPVRVAAHAFGPGQPARNLFLSPDHAVSFEGVLIPVRCLLNGASVAQERRLEITYWHVELARHDVILAEGLPCESFLDTGNRAAFANGGAVANLHPDFAARIWDADACAPLVVAGPRLERAREKLSRRLPTCTAARAASGRRRQR